MKNDIRSSGIGIVGNIPWGTHFCQFYQTKEDLIEIIIPYFKAGLENNEFCLWITSDIIGVEEAKKALAEFISDIDIYFKKGQMEIIPFNDFYSDEKILDSQKVLDDIINRANQALTDGYDGLRLTEDICSFKKEKLDNFNDYEERLNSVIGIYPIIALCTYSLEAYSSSSITDTIEIVLNHDFVLAKKKGKWEIIENSGQRNNTECKQPENALLESEERYRTLFNSMSEGFAIQEIVYNDKKAPVDLKFIDVNPAYERFIGLKRADVIGRLRNDLFTVADPYWLEKYNNVVLTGESTHFENYSKAVGRYFEVYVFPIKPPRFGVIFLDITNRKQLENSLKIKEQHLDDLLNSIQDVFFELDREWRFTYINQHASHIVNSEPEELIGESIWEKFPFMAGSKLRGSVQESNGHSPANHSRARLDPKSMERSQCHPSVAGISVFWGVLPTRAGREGAGRERATYRETLRTTKRALPFTSQKGPLSMLTSA